jgi:hypothetical protein
LLAGLFLLVAAFYALTGPGHSSSNDGLLIMLSARNLLSSGSTAVPPVPLTEGMTRIRGVDGRGYPKFGPGLLLAHLPTLLAARHLEPFQPTVGSRAASSRERDEFYAPFTNAWLMAATVVGVAGCGSALGFPPSACALLAALLALGSPLWLYARSDSTEALQAAGLIGATYFLLRLRTTASFPAPVLAGALFAVAVAAKVISLVLLPWFSFLAFSASARERARTFAYFLAPLVIVVALLGAFNYARFGSPFDTGYDLGSERFDHSLLDGAFVLLLSAGFGLLVFWPAFVLLPFAGRQFLQRFPRESVLIVGVFATYFVLYSKWWAYWGMGWGPRFLIPTVPLLALMLLPWIARRGWRRTLVVATLVIGIPVQAVAVGSAFWGQVAPVWDRLGVPGESLLGEPRVAPLRVGLWWLGNAACHAPGAPRPALSSPPWQRDFPWQDPERAPLELAPLSGLDLWAVPECWKPWIPSSEQVITIPSNPPMRWLLLAFAAMGAILMASARPWARGAGNKNASLRAKA